MLHKLCMRIFIAKVKKNFLLISKMSVFGSAYGTRSQNIRHCELYIHSSDIENRLFHGKCCPWFYATDVLLGPNSTTRKPATDMLYNTTNGYHQRTSSQQFYNKFATSQYHQSPTSRHVKMLGCGTFLSVGGEFAVQ